MTKYISLINGKFTDSVSVLDRGLAYGDGFFETMFWTSKANRNEYKQFGVEFWHQHLNRIKKGCKILKIKFPEDKTILQHRERILKKSFSLGIKSGILKIIITRGVGGRGYKFERNMVPTIIFLTFPSPKYYEKLYTTGIKARYCKSELSCNKDLFGLKHLNRLDSVLARSEWEEDFFEGIFLDKKNNLLEGTMSNIFFIKKNKLYTPTISESGINGVMRQIVIKRSKLFFDKLVVRKINKSIVNDFEQMFLTNSIIKILPVISLANKKFKISDNLKSFIEYFNVNKTREMKKKLEIF